MRTVFIIKFLERGTSSLAPARERRQWLEEAVKSSKDPLFALEVVDGIGLLVPEFLVPLFVRNSRHNELTIRRREVGHGVLDKGTVLPLGKLFCREIEIESSFDPRKHAGSCDHHECMVSEKVGKAND